MELKYGLGMTWQCIGTVKKTLPAGADGQVGNKGREGRTGKDQLLESLDSGQMVKEFGSHWTGNGESLKNFEQVEQGKDVTC